MSRLAGGCLLAVVLAIAGGARAEPEGVAREASKHFQRGVDLYNDGDFRGALVEFKKAHSVLPRATVLYNIGQTQYQLHEYAQALATLERFLSETGRNADHRAEVEETAEVLRGRVGRIVVASDHLDCEVSVDDQPAGTTPVPQPISVSVGARKVAVSCPGRPRVTREVDVTGGETVRVELNMGPELRPAALATTAAPSTAGTGKRGSTAAWIITGVLAAATAGAYAAAIVEARQLGDLRRTYPITPEALDDKVTLTSRLALTGDVLAATTAVAAGVAVYLGWSSHEEGRVQVGLSPAGVAVRGTF